MRRSYFRLLEGVLLSLPLLFASCGNGDNALEEIINGGGSEGGGSSTIAVTGVTLKEAYLRFDKNVLTAQTLTVTVAPDDATDKTVTWESSDESVATVDENGQVTPKTKGTVTITATAHDGSGIKATSTVIVYDKIFDISTGDADVTAGEEWLIKGNATTPVANSINIGDGASATLLDVFITQPITCSATATIILADGSTNTVDASGINNKAAIQIGGTGKTLTIDAETEGTGTLTAKGGSEAAGIGTSMNGTGGNIVINGGTVTATGGGNGAGIGTGCANGSTIECGDITINGGTVTATGGMQAAGIGTGCSLNSTPKCGAITIDTGVTSVTATKGAGSPNSIGTGKSYINQKCGTITFGTAQVFDGTDATGTWNPNPMVADTYGGLNLVISKKDVDGDTWTLTPAN